MPTKHPKRFMVTGGAGFIGSAVVRKLIQTTPNYVLVLDKLTYAGNLASLAPIAGNSRYEFVQADVCDNKAVSTAFRSFRPDTVMHLAAESHVDRSIDRPDAFIQTNVYGTYSLLKAAHGYWRDLSNEYKAIFRFHHISTDEVYDSLGSEGSFCEDAPYSPRSPYATSKAGSDHIARAWWHTYGLPVLVTNCSNNYGPYQFPEKLIPLITLNALEGKPLPVYGRGEHIRDWIYVDDHAAALLLVADRGEPGHSYNIGGRCEQRNIDVVAKICDLIDELRPPPTALRVVI